MIKLDEAQTLELMISVCDMWYHRTGDKWWLGVAISAAQKKKGVKWDFSEKSDKS